MGFEFNSDNFGSYSVNYEGDTLLIEQKADKSGRTAIPAALQAIQSFVESDSSKDIPNDELKSLKSFVSVFESKLESTIRAKHSIVGGLIVWAQRSFEFGTLGTIQKIQNKLNTPGTQSQSAKVSKLVIHLTEQAPSPPSTPVVIAPITDAATKSQSDRIQSVASQQLPMEPPAPASVESTQPVAGPQPLPSESHILPASKAESSSVPFTQATQQLEPLVPISVESAKPVAAPTPQSSESLVLPASQAEPSSVAFTQATQQFKEQIAGKTIEDLWALVDTRYSDQKAQIEERMQGIQAANSLEPLEALKIALFIETVICKVQAVADRILHPEESGLSHRLILTSKSIYVLDLKKSVLGKGKFKTALKVMQIFQNMRPKVAFVANLEMHTGSEEHLSFARTEAEIFKLLDGRPGIIPFFTAQEWTRTVQDNRVTSVSMICLLAEGSLTEQVPSLNAPQKLQVASDILTGVTSMHDANVAHCDLKLDNVLYYIASDGSFRAGISDFGLSVKIDASGKGEKRFPGQYGSITETPPELLLTKKTTPFTGDCKKCDSWAVGCMLYRIFVQQELPWDAVLGELNQDKTVAARRHAKVQMEKSVPEALEALDALPKSIPQNVRDAIRGLLNCDPEKRMTVQQALQLVKSS